MDRRGICYDAKVSILYWRKKVKSVLLQQHKNSEYHYAFYTKKIYVLNKIYFSLFYLGKLHFSLSILFGSFSTRF